MRYDLKSVRATAGGEKTMGNVLFPNHETSRGATARRLRISRLLTQEELARSAAVSLEEVRLFEQDLPVCLEAKRRLLKKLWPAKANRAR